MWWWKRKNPKPHISVLFSRVDSTYEEEFVGIALTQEQEKAMGQHVDSDTLSCWTEKTELHGWTGELNEHHFPPTVYLVFNDGPPQNHEKTKTSDDLDPSLVAAFTTREAAEQCAHIERKDDPQEEFFSVHVWEVPFGWMPEPYASTGPPIPNYYP